MAFDWQGHQPGVPPSAYERHAYDLVREREIVAERFGVIRKGNDSIRARVERALPQVGQQVAIANRINQQIPRESQRTTELVNTQQPAEPNTSAIAKPRVRIAALRNADAYPLSPSKRGPAFYQAPDPKSPEVVLRIPLKEAKQDGIYGAYFMKPDGVRQDLENFASLAGIAPSKLKPEHFTEETIVCSNGKGIRGDEYLRRAKHAFGYHGKGRLLGSWHSEMAIDSLLKVAAGASEKEKVAASLGDQPTIEENPAKTERRAVFSRQKYIRKALHLIRAGVFDKEDDPQERGEKLTHAEKQKRARLEKNALVQELLRNNDAAERRFGVRREQRQHAEATKMQPPYSTILAAIQQEDELAEHEAVVQAAPEHRVIGVKNGVTAVPPLDRAIFPDRTASRDTRYRPVVAAYEERARKHEKMLALPLTRFLKKTRPQQPLTTKRLPLGAPGNGRWADVFWDEIYEEMAAEGR